MPPKAKSKKVTARATTPANQNQATMVVTLYDGTRQPTTFKTWAPTPCLK